MSRLTFILSWTLVATFAGCSGVSVKYRGETGAEYGEYETYAWSPLTAPGPETISAMMIGRRLVEDGALATVTAAMEVAGGRGFYRKAELERLFRDVQAARYHPLQADVQEVYAGAVALGQSADAIW